MDKLRTDLRICLDNFQGNTAMFHAFDNDGPGKPLARADWIALLSRAPLELLETALAAHTRVAPRWLRQPETGLMMVQGRAGATGERFNLGEVTVTRCALRLAVEPGPGSGVEPGALVPTAVGVGYVLGRSHRHARLAATADALLQDPAHIDGLTVQLIQPVREHLSHLRSARHARAQSTKVEFFTVAREAGTPDSEEDSE